MIYCAVTLDTVATGDTSVIEENTVTQLFSINMYYTLHDHVETYMKPVLPG